MIKKSALSTGYLPFGGLSKNSVARLTDHPDMTLAVDGGHKAPAQTNKTACWVIGDINNDTVCNKTSCNKQHIPGKILDTLSKFA